MASNRETPTHTWRGKGTGEVDRIIGQKLKLRRTILQISQHELAHKVGTTPQQLQKYEAGQTRVSASRLYRLAEELKVPLTWFFTDATGGRAGSLPHRARITSASRHLSRGDDVVHLLTYYQRVRDPEVRRILVSLARYLASDHGAD